MRFYPVIQKTVCTPRSLADTNALLRTAIAKIADSKIKRADDRKILFHIQYPHALGRNSFLPAVEVDLSETPEGTQVTITAKLKLSVRIVMAIIMAVAAFFLLMEMLLLFRGELAKPALLLIPVGIAVWGYLCAHVGLRASSRYMFKSLIADIKAE